MTRRVSLNAASVVGALCIPSVVFCSADPVPDKHESHLSINPIQVTQGSAFTVFFNPPNILRQPATVTVGPVHSSVQTPVFNTAVVTVAPSAATSVVISVLPNAQTGAVGMTVAWLGVQILPTFSITIQSTSQAASPEPSTSQSSSIPATSALTSPVTSPASSSSTGIINSGSASATQTNSVDTSLETTTTPRHTSGTSDPPSSTTQVTSPFSIPSTFSLGGAIAPSISETTVATANTTSTGEPGDRSHVLSAGQISGIVIGLLLFPIVLILLFCWRKKRRFQGGRKPLSFGTDHNSFGQFMVEKFPLANHEPEHSKARLPENSRSPFPGNFSNRINPVDMETFSNSSSGSLPPQYPSNIAITPVEKKSYGSQNLEELQEQRNKMRDLIDVLKERRNSVSGVPFVHGGKAGDLEVGPFTPVREVRL